MKRTLMAAACLFGIASAASATTLDPLALFAFDNGSTALNLTPSGGTSGLETTININKSSMPSMSMGG